MQETSTSPASLPGSPRLENIEDRILPHPKNLSSDVPAAEYAEHLAVEMSALGHSPTVDESASRLRSGDSTDLPVYWRRRQPEFMWTQVSKEKPSQPLAKGSTSGQTLSISYLLEFIQSSGSFARANVHTEYLCIAAFWLHQADFRVCKSSLCIHYANCPTCATERLQRQFARLCSS